MCPSYLIYSVLYGLEKVYDSYRFSLELVSL